jgi:GT2 family glycosyltransferase
VGLLIGLGVEKMLPNLVVPTLNRYDLLQNMFNSVDYPVKHLLVIDNGGRLGDVDVPDCVEQLTVLRMPSNLGVASSWNLGIKAFPFAPVWFIVSDDVTFHPGGLQTWHECSSPGRVTVSDRWPFFQIMSVGEQVVDRVGLFDEGLHPANFEDDDYEWRCGVAGFPVERANVPLDHVRQGTVFHSDYAQKNEATYSLNEKHFVGKRDAGDVSAGEWSLSRRRLLSWD